MAEQKKLFSRREIKAADAARELYRKIGRPDETEFDSILRRNLIRNCPVTPNDAKRALIIYGPDVAVLKGKTTQSTPAPHVPTFEAVPIPPPVLEHHSQVTLCMDFFFVQGMPFYHTISRGIGFRTVKQVSDRSKAVILPVTRRVIKLYQSRGFKVSDIHADNEFECIRENVRPVEMNIVPSVRTIKERLRTCVHGLPFERLPKLMIRHMVDDAVRCLNQFPWKNGISADMSPAAIVTGHPPPDFNTMRLEFGTYVQVFEDNDPTNTTRARSMGAIALGPTGNAQGDFNFMSLSSGAKISRHQWTALPMTDTSIARVHALGIEDNQPLIQERGLVVEWRPDHPIDDSEYDRTYNLPRNLPVDGFVPADYDPIDDDEAADLLHDAAEHDLIIEPAAERAALAQGVRADEDVNPHHAQPAIVADNDDNEDATGKGANDDATDEGANDDNEGATDEGANDEYEAAGNEGAHDDNAVYEDEEDDAFNEGPHDNEENDDDVANAGQEHARAEDEPINETTNDNRPYNLRHRGAPTARFNEAMDNPHDGKSYYPPIHPRN